MANKNLTAEQIMTRGSVEGFTAYQIAKLINIRLAEAGFQDVRPQMIYNYDRNGMIVKGEKNVTARRTFTKDEVTAFVDKFVTKRMSQDKYKIQTVEAPKTQEITDEVITMMGLVEIDE